MWKKRKRRRVNLKAICRSNLSSSACELLAPRNQRGSRTFLYRSSYSGFERVCGFSRNEFGLNYWYSRAARGTNPTLSAIPK